MTALSAGKLWGLRRLADAAGRFKMLAVDQRPPIKTLIREQRDGGAAPYEDVCAVKALLTRELAPAASAVLLDPHFAYPAAIAHVGSDNGVILTLEDSLFEETPGGRKSAEIADWSVAQIKRTGADAVKVLARYRPDAAAAVRDVHRPYRRGLRPLRHSLCLRAAGLPAAGRRPPDDRLCRAPGQAPGARAR